MTTINYREDGEFGDGATIRTDITRPIIGIENRTPLEVFDIMCDRIKHAQAPNYATALQQIAAHEPSEKHNGNLNDLIAHEAVRVAREALKP